MAKRKTKKQELGPPTFESELVNLLNENFIDADVNSPIVSRLKEFLRGQDSQITSDEDVLIRVKQNMFSGQKFNKGSKCPCCSQHVKLYKRRLNANMCYYLIQLYRFTKHSEKGEKYFSVEKIGLNYQLGGDWARLRHWGLIEEMKNHDETKRTSGYWGITEKGKEFVNMQIKVPEKLLINNNQVHGFEGKEIDLKQALKNKFNYAQLMEQGM